MKQEQKIALALALIGGGYYYFNKNEETRNGSEGLTPNDKILEILKDDYNNKKLSKKEEYITNDRLIPIIKGYGVIFTGNYQKDEKLNTIFPRDLELDLDYFNSVIRRSGIYLYGGMFANLMNAITEIDDDQRDFISKNAGIIDQIQYDFGENKEIYNILTEDNKELKNYGSKAKYVRADFIMNFFKIESKLALAIAIGLEKIGYYDQE